MHLSVLMLRQNIPLPTGGIPSTVFSIFGTFLAVFCYLFPSYIVRPSIWSETEAPRLVYVYDRNSRFRLLYLYSWQKHTSLIASARLLRRILCDILYRIHYAIFLYAIPHIILKSSPKGEVFYPFHVLGIKISKNCKTAALERS